MHMRAALAGQRLVTGAGELNIHAWCAGQSLGQPLTLGDAQRRVQQRVGLPLRLPQQPKLSLKLVLRVAVQQVPGQRGTWRRRGCVP